MGEPIQELTIEGFKSIRRLDRLPLRNLNILIGPNGAGKSNFVELLRLARAFIVGDWPTLVRKEGGSDGLFFGGPKMTPEIHLDFQIDGVHLGFFLEPTADGNVILGREGSATAANYLKAWTVYHFHDTSSLSPMRRLQLIEDTAYLRPDASNIAAFLRAVRADHPAQYALILDTIRLVAPFFKDFSLTPRQEGNATMVSLDWQQTESDFPFQPWHLSDGTLRMICLTTALLQPHPPSTLVIDEPELGLHPHALEILAGLIQKASQKVQVIVSTQSAPLLNYFEPEDIITVRRQNGASTFARLQRAPLEQWLKDYTLGELWQKNVVEAGVGSD